MSLLCDLPVVALTASSRKFGIVCLNARLAPVLVRLCDIRKRKATQAKIVAMIDELDKIATNLAPGTILLECNPRRPRRVVPGRSRVVEWAEDRGLKIVLMSAADACAHISRTPNTLSAAERLAGQYPPLAEVVLDGNGRLLRSHDRWRDVRPLVIAFALAHAFSSEAVTTAFGSSSQPLRNTPPHYDPRSSPPP